MAIDPKAIQVYLPAWMGGAKKLLLQQIARGSGRLMTSNPEDLDALPADVLPLICCTGEIMPQVQRWQKTGRTFLYWDRGYLRRIGGLWLPTDGTTGYLRFNLNTFQMQEIRKVPPDRWNRLQVPVKPWHQGGRKVVVATTNSSYWQMHSIEGWLDRTLVTLREHTDRPVIVRHKDSKLPLEAELEDAHCLVAHGSNAAIESVILGCPVIVDKISAAALVGRTELSDVERLVYPDREPWLHSLAYSQYSELEVVSGQAWSMVR